MEAKISIITESCAGLQGVAATCCMQTAMEGLSPGSGSCRTQVHLTKILWASEFFPLLESRWVPKEN